MARSSMGARSLSKAQGSKQWYSGVPFWDGIRSAVADHMGLDASDGIAWVDLLPYDDKLVHSVIQAYSQQSAKVPTQMLITTVWACMGVQGPDQS